MRPAPEAAAGTIYDIGYRRYEGARLGRGYAFRTLYTFSLRTAFGLGRGGRALIAPWLLFFVIMLPGLIQVAAAAISQGEAKLVGYDDYFSYVQLLVALFCAAQAPELVSNDQHRRVLPLYFSRALRRHDYAAAKLLAMTTALLVLTVAPQATIFVGKLSLGTDVAAAFRAEAGQIPPILGSGLAVSLVLGSISVAFASLAPRRSLASAAILGFFLLSGALAGALGEMSDGLEPYMPLVNPLLTALMVTRSLFGTLAVAVRADMPAPVVLEPWQYLAAAAAYTAVALAVLFTRYARVRT